MRFLIDEMFPPATVHHLADLGHDAIDARSAGLSNDALVMDHATQHALIVVTENYADFAHCTACTVLFVSKASLPAGGAMAHELAKQLATWAATQPVGLGVHWL